MQVNHASEQKGSRERSSLATGSLARLEAEIEQFFATATREEIETLLKKSKFDYYNKIGTDILPPREAPENGALLALLTPDMDCYSAVIIARRYIEGGKAESAIALLRSEADKLRGHSPELYAFLANAAGEPHLGAH
jgi:hypothetical protein